MSDLSHPTNFESDSESAYSGYDPTYSSDEPMYPKRQRLRGRIRKAAVDLFTALPESLLLHVLSFLPIEDAVKTQVLSKRWLHLWTYSTSLVFLHDWDKSVCDFVTFVDRTLVLCNCTKLKKLGVWFAYEPDYVSNVNLWNLFAMGKGVEELQLDFDDMRSVFYEVDYYSLPQLLYTNLSFKALQFNSCSVVPRGVVCWNSLKKLSIGSTRLSESVIQKILIGSPVLEILELYHFYGFHRLHVSNKSVNKLILRDFEHDEEVEKEYRTDRYHSVFEVSAPHLHSLEISGDLGDKICWLGDLSSLVDANLNFHMSYRDRSDEYIRYENMLRGLLRCLVHVKKITLGTLPIQVLSIMEEKGLRSPTLNCESLTLDTNIWKSVLPGIANMLESSPNLKTLVIMESSSGHRDYIGCNLPELQNFAGKSYWTSKKKAFKCSMLGLQEIKFIGLGSYDFDFRLSFAQYVLKNARVLQKMVINSKTESCNWPKELVRAARKLLSFPRSSPNAVVLF